MLLWTAIVVIYAVSEHDFLVHLNSIFYILPMSL